MAAEGDALVAGNICNTWAYDPEAPERSGAVVREMYREQVGWAAEEGAELDHLRDQRLPRRGADRARGDPRARAPGVVTFASTSDRTIDGHELDDACRRLEEAGADVVGLNCSRGPATILPLLERVRAAVDGHVAAQPVPYRTTPEAPTFQSLRDIDGARGFPVALEPFLCSRFEMADFAAAARDLGVGFIGDLLRRRAASRARHGRAAGADGPGGRYSPDISLHPVLGDDVREPAKKFANWKD